MSDHNFKKLKEHILPLSDSKDWITACGEWDEREIKYEPSICPCGVHIVFQHWMHNRLTQEETYVGSVCIERFMSRDVKQKLADFKAMRKKAAKKAREEADRIAREEQKKRTLPVLPVPPVASGPPILISCHSATHFRFISEASTLNAYSATLLQLDMYGGDTVHQIVIWKANPKNTEDATAILSLRDALKEQAIKSPNNPNEVICHSGYYKKYKKEIFKFWEQVC